MLIPASLPFTPTPYSLGASALFPKSCPQSVSSPEPTSCVDTPRLCAQAPGLEQWTNTPHSWSWVGAHSLVPLRDLGAVFSVSRASHVGTCREQGVRELY